MGLTYGKGTRDFLATLAPKPRKAIRDALRLIDEDPRHPKLALKLLRGRGATKIYRARVGDYRIVFSPRPAGTHVWRIMHRSDGYDWLDHMDPWPAP